MEFILALLRLGADLKKEKRVGWSDKEHGRDVPNPKSDADHSFNMGLFALAIGLDRERFPGIDPLLLIILCLVHELVEALGHDSNSHHHAKTPEERNRLLAEKSAREQAAILEIGRRLGPVLGPKIVELWQMYESGNQPEAVLAREIDKVELVIQALFYHEEGHRSDPNGFFESAMKRVQNPHLRQLLETFVQPRLPR